MKESVYVDSNVFIFPVIHSEDHKLGKVSKSTEILASIESRRLIAYSSWLTWDEVAWVVLRTLGRADSLEISRKLSNFPNLRFVDVNAQIMGKAQEIMEKYDLAPRDAVHCASAIYKNLKIVISDDSDLERCLEIKRIPLEDF